MIWKYCEGPKTRPFTQRNRQQCFKFNSCSHTLRNTVIPGARLYTHASGARNAPLTGLNRALVI